MDSAGGPGPSEPAPCPPRAPGAHVRPQTDTCMLGSRVRASEGLSSRGGWRDLGGAHLDAVQQPAHAPVRVSLHVAQHVLGHPGDVGGVRVLVVCGRGRGRQGAVRSQEDVCRAYRNVPRPPNPGPPPSTSLALTGRLVFHLIT